jgi:dihydroorotase
MAGGKDMTTHSVIASDLPAKAWQAGAKQSQTVDATGLVICPGFIDLHCHLREPGFEDKETIATGTKAAAIGGFTTVCCMANTEPPLDNAAAVARVGRKAGKDGLVGVFPIGCISKGRKGQALTDMAGLAEAGVVAFGHRRNLADCPGVYIGG